MTAIIIIVMDKIFIHTKEKMKMKRSVIREVFNGSRGSASDMKMSEAEREIMVEVDEAYDELWNKLDPEQQKLFEEFLSLRERAFCEDADNHYVEGYKLGLLIGVECGED